jgi:hypothetical protein
MHKIEKILFGFFIIFLVWSCAPTAKTANLDLSPKPEEIYTFSVSPGSTSREAKDNRPAVLKDFPFISAQPVSGFMGKFPPEFYSGIKYRWSAEYITFVDFWKLRHNQNLYDVIYITPLWIGDMSLKDADLLKDIAFSYNISDEQLKILDNWIRGGGILWIESAIYISSYDYNLNKLNDEKVKELADRLGSMTLLGNKLNVFTLTARKIDEFNVEKLSLEVTPDKSEEIGKINRDVNRLLLEQPDYIGIYFTVEGNPTIKSGDVVYASYKVYGKGKIITLVPFNFKNVQYDGEIFRLDLLSWALNDRK